MPLTQIKKEVKIFLASSSELELERIHTGDLFNDINSALADTDVRIRLLKWESFNPSFRGNRKQSEYDEQVKKADVFVVMFFMKTGKLTMEEVETAIAAHAQSGNPKELHCFIKDCQKKCEFDIGKLKADLGSDFVIDAFSDTRDFKLKLVKILMPFLNAFDITVTETDKFVQVNNINLLRK
jgi:hypothetical protein